MFDKESIELLQEGAAIHQAANAVALGFEANKQAVALPEKFRLQDLEGFMSHRRRARGLMSTESVNDFAKYFQNHVDQGAVFVDKDAMKAVGKDLHLWLLEQPLP